MATLMPKFPASLCWDCLKRQTCKTDVLSVFLLDDIGRQNVTVSSEVIVKCNEYVKDADWAKPCNVISRGGILRELGR